MLNQFVALRFTEDKNIYNRGYWYLSDIPLKEGDGVLAPIGSHNRLQFARVERVLFAEDSHAPYDVNLIKRVTALYGKNAGEKYNFPCCDLGGFRYDKIHFTQYDKFIFVKNSSAASCIENIHSGGKKISLIVNMQHGDKEAEEGDNREISFPFAPRSLYGEEGLSDAFFELLSALAKTEAGTLFLVSNADAAFCVAAVLLSLSGVSERMAEEKFLREFAALYMGRESAFAREFLIWLSQKGGAEKMLKAKGLKEEITLLKEKMQ